MRTFQRIRAVLLPTALTLACVAGVAGTLQTPRVQGQSSCPNTECEGVTECRYARTGRCSFNEAGTECTNTNCSRSVLP